MVTSLPSLGPQGDLALHAELDQAASKDAQGADDAHCHEDAQQNVIQHHGNELPLFCSLGRQALRTSGFLVMGDWKVTDAGAGLPEMSEISKSAEKTCLSCFSLEGRFMVEKNMMLGMVVCKVSEQQEGNSTGVSGQVEDQAGEEGEEHAGDDDVDDEVERQAEHEEVVSDVQVRRVRTAGVVHPVLPAAVVLHHPLAALHEAAQVRPVAVLGEEGEGSIQD
ncbi:hypothetical protein JZ751_020198 [Albula glossodonta]|uniref:Uncharacterized protein n=1 Tax=Albula glossodonta TaxID=121402 RepID=A0A8T2NJV9_9TELE|nr:hypothetical protein JZ751_020198 [Albula glossodonta]